MNGVPGVGLRVPERLWTPSGLVGDDCKDWICAECVPSIAPDLPPVKSLSTRCFQVTNPFQVNSYNETLHSSVYYLDAYGTDSQVTQITHSGHVLCFIRSLTSRKRHPHPENRGRRTQNGHRRSCRVPSSCAMSSSPISTVDNSRSGVSDSRVSTSSMIPASLPMLMGRFSLALTILASLSDGRTFPACHLSSPPYKESHRSVHRW